MGEQTPLAFQPNSYLQVSVIPTASRQGLG